MQAAFVRYGKERVKGGVNNNYRPMLAEITMRCTSLVPS